MVATLKARLPERKVVVHRRLHGPGSGTVFVRRRNLPAAATVHLRVRPQLLLPPAAPRRHSGPQAIGRARPRKLHALFVAALIIVGGISCIDGILNIVYPVTAEVEENPIAAAILRASNDNIALLMTLKAAGTIFVLGFLALYSRWRYAKALLIAGTLAVFQMLALTYILYA
jgi:hypothetical protein